MLFQRLDLSRHFLLELPSSRLIGNLDAHLDDELADLRFLNVSADSPSATMRSRKTSGAIGPMASDSLADMIFKIPAYRAGPSWPPVSKFHCL